MGSIQEIWQSTAGTPGFTPNIEEPRWYAIHTRARHEKVVTARLQGVGITTFLPLIREAHRWSDRQKTVQSVLFACYTFVCLEAYSQKYHHVRDTPGVIAFVGIRGVGLPIPEKELEDIRTMLANKIPCTPHPFLHTGRRVRIRGGCLDGLEGILTGKNSDQSLVVSIDIIQRSVGVRIEGYDIEPV